jgi:hypothetical protein
VRLPARHDVELALDEPMFLPPPALDFRIGHGVCLLGRAAMHKQRPAFAPTRRSGASAAAETNPFRA